MGLGRVKLDKQMFLDLKVTTINNSRVAVYPKSTLIDKLQKKKVNECL